VDIGKIINDLAQDSAIISITDKNGTIIYANKAFAAISKYSVEELMGQNHRIIKSGYHPPEFYASMWRAISSGKVWRGEIKNRAKDGTYYWVKTVIMPILDNDGKPEYYASIRIDITPMKLALELSRENKELQDKNEKLRILDQVQKDFLNIAAHELRTPITCINLQMELARYIESDSGRKEVVIPSESYNIINENTKKLARLSLNIFDALMVMNQTLKLDRTEFDLTELIEEVVAKSKSLIPDNKTIEIIYSPNDQNLIVNADRKRISQVLSNLIRNAIHFTEKMESGITVTSKKNDHDGGDHYAVVSVIDDGCGICSEMMSKLFQRFSSVSSGPILGGTGLELYISKGIIEAHGGSISAENNAEGKGAKFTFILPLAKN
jgi:PAS domain S-box-containing protein